MFVNCVTYNEQVNDPGQPSLANPRVSGLCRFRSRRPPRPAGQCDRCHVQPAAPPADPREPPFDEYIRDHIDRLSAETTYACFVIHLAGRLVVWAQTAMSELEPRHRGARVLCERLHDFGVPRLERVDDAYANVGADHAAQHWVVFDIVEVSESGDEGIHRAVLRGELGIPEIERESRFDGDPGLLLLWAR